MICRAGESDPRFQDPLPYLPLEELILGSKINHHRKLSDHTNALYCAFKASNRTIFQNLKSARDLLKCVPPLTQTLSLRTRL